MQNPDEPFDIYRDFNFSDFLNFAIQLAEISKNPGGAILVETLQRNAASRAYYAAFHGVKVFLSKVENNPIGHESIEHGVVWAQFKKQDYNRSKVYVAATKLKSWRQWADYNKPGMLPPVDVQEIFDAVLEIQISLSNICDLKQKPKSLCWLLSAAVSAPPSGHKT